MKRCLPVVAMLALAACGEADDRAAPGPQQPVEPPEVDTTTILTGAQAYDQVCASCHEEGVNGAPLTGDQDAWTGRSPLWEAVLFEHARSGWLDMPAKGGVEALDDATVTKAAEYMLSITYPEAKTNSVLP
jgi:cytochrome c5